MLDIIDEFLDIQEDENEVWKVEDDLSADWCLDKIRESQAEYRRFEMVANTKIQQIQEALIKEKKKADDEISFFESKLREYFENVEQNSKETKTQRSYKLPSGALKLKKAKIDFDYDKTKLVEVADTIENMKDYIKIKKDFNWAEFKKNLKINGNSIVNKETGEIVEIEGLRLIEKPEEFTVEV